MTRQELIQAAIEIAESDMANMGISREELVAEAHKLSDNELKAFIEE
jgi:cell division protein FtsB